MNLSSITKSECKDLVDEIINYQENTKLMEL